MRDVLRRTLALTALALSVASDILRVAAWALGQAAVARRPPAPASADEPLDLEGAAGLEALQRRRGL